MAGSRPLVQTAGNLTELLDGGALRVPSVATLPAGGSNPNSLNVVNGHIYADLAGTQYQLDQQAGGPPNVRVVTAATTFAANDANIVVDVSTVPSNTDVTLPSGIFPVGTILALVQRNKGRARLVAGTSVTFIGAADSGVAALRNKNSGLTALQTATDVWQIAGDTISAPFGTFIKLTGGDGSGNTYTTVSGNGFNSVPFNALSGLSNDPWALDSNGLYVPYAGLYGVIFTVRLVDGSPPRNFGMGVGPTNADSPDFYWDTNNAAALFDSSSASARAGANRKTFQYVDDLVLPQGYSNAFIYSDGANAPITNCALALSLKGRS